MTPVLPEQLEEGDTIGVVSPSSSIEQFPRRTKRGKIALENAGFKVVFGEHALKDANAEEKATDIMSMFLDDEIKAILCSTGGWTANTILNHLDFQAIHENPKIFCGFSDITALNLAIHKKTNLITFNGPTLLPSLGEYNGPHEYTMKWFKKVFMSKTPIGKLESPSSYTDEILYWDEEDDRRRKMKPASSTKFYGKVKASGKLIGGNLSTLNILIGTEFQPDMEGNILLVEEEQGSVARYHRRLTYLEHVDVIDKIDGLIVSRPSGFASEEKQELRQVLQDLANRYQLPTAAWTDSGHTDPMIPLPIGASVSLDPDKEEIRIEEGAVK